MASFIYFQNYWMGNLYCLAVTAGINIRVDDNSDEYPLDGS